MPQRPCNRPEYRHPRPRLKRPRLDYTRVYYDLGKFISPSGQIIPHDKNQNINSVERYTQGLFNFSTSY